MLELGLREDVRKQDPKHGEGMLSDQEGRYSVTLLLCWRETGVKQIRTHWGRAELEEITGAGEPGEGDASIVPTVPSLVGQPVTWRVGVRASPLSFPQGHLVPAPETGSWVAGLEMATSGCAKTSRGWGRATLGLGVPEP